MRVAAGCRDLSLGCVERFPPGPGRLRLLTPTTFSRPRVGTWKHSLLSDAFRNLPPSPPRRFQLILIKPSHYDDDGYVIRWWRGIIPSNSLAAVYGIAADCAERRVLEPDVAIDIEAIDETTSRVDVEALLARLRRHSHFGLVALVGVQSNQYPRALDIARPFRAAPRTYGVMHGR